MWSCCHLSAHSVCTIQPCTSLQHFMHSHIWRVHVCLAVTCHLHFWQNHWGPLQATALTQGWNGRPTVQHSLTPCRQPYAGHALWRSWRRWGGVVGGGGGGLWEEGCGKRGPVRGWGGWRWVIGRQKSMSWFCYPPSLISWFYCNLICSPPALNSWFYSNLICSPPSISEQLILLCLLSFTAPHPPSFHPRYIPSVHMCACMWCPRNTILSLDIILEVWCIHFVAHVKRGAVSPSSSVRYHAIEMTTIIITTLVQWCVIVHSWQ